MTNMEELPWYSRTATFLRAPLGDYEDVKPGMVVVSGAPHTMQVRFNERQGPNGIRESSLFIADKLRNAADQGVLDISTGRRMSLRRDAQLLDVGDVNSYPTNVMRATEGMAGGVAEVVRRGGFSVCLGGDHYVGYPSCLGYTRPMTETNPNVKIGYIHIDGHLDMTDEGSVCLWCMIHEKVRKLHKSPC